MITPIQVRLASSVYKFNHPVDTIINQLSQDTSNFSYINVNGSS